MIRLPNALRILTTVLTLGLATPAAFAQSNETIQTVIDTLSASLGIEANELTAESNIVEDFGIDRTRMYYAVTELFQIERVEDPEEELIEIGEIAAYIDRQRELNLTLRAGDEEEIAYYNQRVFFATNRNAQPDAPINKRFGTGRVSDQTLRYGYADVNIPTSHIEGQIETPFRNIQFLIDPRKHIFMTDIAATSGDDFFDTMSATLADASSDDILVYIHGYNVSFNDALIRAAQIAVDFDFEGLPIAFTWPSNARTISYASDWADALWSAQYLENFLADLQTKYPGQKIHVLAHSMGNKVLLHAARQMAARGEPSTLENIILCAPDFDAQFFVDQIANDVRPLAKHWTLYTSENDLALNVSNRLSNAPRLGSPRSEITGYEVINASKIEVSPWSVPENHSYYAVKSRVIEDITAVISGTRPNDRALTVDITGKVWSF